MKGAGGKRGGGTAGEPAQSCNRHKRKAFKITEPELMLWVCFYSLKSNPRPFKDPPIELCIPSPQYLEN